jgi:hypothetical protein
MTPIFNKDLPDVFDPLDYTVQPEDMGYELVWYLDLKFFPDKCRVWHINTVDDPVRIKRMGFVKPNLPEDLDVVFISYDEPNAQDNWEHLLKICPRAKRVMGVKGIYQAHQAASYIAKTDMFYVVDGDSWITDFNFDFIPSIFDRNYIHIFKSVNPVNGLEYGNGAVKLIPRNAFTEVEGIDVTTSLGQIKLVDRIVCETRFNNSEFNAWRSAFRECVKLSSSVINNQDTAETLFRLKVWCSKGIDKPFGNYVVRGAQDGKAYGDANRTNNQALKMINDFKWLYDRFKLHYQ